jgi:membrane protein implicated in regulation of membrane protease activity
MAARTFGREFRERGSFVWWTLIVNTILLSGYVAVAYSGPDAQLFWSVGMALTVVICAVMAIVTAVVVKRDRKERRKRLLRESHLQEGDLAQKEAALERKPAVQPRGISARRTDLPPLPGRGAKLSGR